MPVYILYHLLPTYSYMSCTIIGDGRQIEGNRRIATVSGYYRTKYSRCGTCPHEQIECSYPVIIFSVVFGTVNVKTIHYMEGIFSMKHRVPFKVQKTIGGRDQCVSV